MFSPFRKSVKSSIKLLIIFICFTFSSCSDTKNRDLFFQPVSPKGGTHVSAVPTDSSHLFSKDFWNYLTSHFGSGSIELFYVGHLPYPQSLASDTAYVFSIVSSDNREKLLRYFPKDLTEEESKNYVEEMTTRTKEYPVEVTKPAWAPAPVEIQEEYKQFYQILVDKEHDHILVMKRSFYNRVLEGLGAPRISKAF